MGTSQKSEVRSQKSEVRSQKSEGRSQKEEGKMAGYKKLIVWQKADDLAYQVYVETMEILQIVRIITYDL
ncbi:MAG: hypothetical protein KKH34_09245 [Candidatus Omnitrophica bacterium]|nr:hypothetical protein [Candidatus Omnitrophota bacterium]